MRQLFLLQNALILLQNAGDITKRVNFITIRGITFCACWLINHK